MPHINELLPIARKLALGMYRSGWPLNEMWIGGTSEEPSLCLVILKEGVDPAKEEKLLSVVQSKLELETVAYQEGSENLKRFESGAGKFLAWTKRRPGSSTTWWTCRQQGT